MYKIMLVEDEALVRESMIQNINWQTYGFEMACACENGRDAIECLPEVSPDVVITDICMPIVDGLELARHIQERYPTIFVVILTGFNEFSYAQQAVQLRVHDFLLKPVKPKDFCAILEKLAGELDARSSKRDNLRTLHASARRGQEMLKNLLFKQILHEPTPAAEIRAAAEKAGLLLTRRVYSIALCRAHDASDSIKNTQRLLDAAQATAVRFPHCFCALVDDRYAMLLLGGHTTAEVAQRAKDVGVMMVSAVTRACNLPAQLGVGGCCTDLSELHRAAAEACHALGYGFSLDRSVILDSAALADERLVSKEGMPPSERGILASQQAHDEAGAQAKLTALFCSFTSRGLHRDVCVPVLERLRFALMELIPEIAQDAAPVVPPSEAWFRAPVVQSQFSQLISFIHRRALPTADDPATRCVSAAQTCILQNYHDAEFSLAALLVLLNVSKSYFSAVFKAQTGQTFIEYLTTTRMERAKYFLKNTTLCGYEIAERIGFTDPHYFSVTFKHHVGLTPREYREGTS